MLPTRALRLQLGTTLAADPATLAPVANANLAALVAAPFALNENHVPADFTLASFTGSTPLPAALGAQAVGNNPLTGQQVIQIIPPVGGWRWQCTVAPGSPQTIYGYILTDHTGAVLLAMALLPSPITIAAIGDFINLDELDLSFVLQPIN